MTTQNSKQLMQKEPQIQYLKDYQPSAYAIEKIELFIDFKPLSSTVTSILHVNRASETIAGTPLRLDGEELELLSILIDGKALSDEEYMLDAESLTLSTPPAGPFKLQTEVNIQPEKNTKLMGIYRSSSIWTSQCEAEGFRRITYMLDRPDIMATYRVHMQADKTLAPILLSNGNLVETGDTGAGLHFAIWDDPHPKPTYLFAVVAGELDHISDNFTTHSGRDVELAIYCEPGKGEKCHYAMGALKRSMKWDEERFGREYDLSVFNIVAVSDFNAGAMENKGLNIFNDKYILADPSSATDQDYYNIERIVAHEYFHNWTGNRITCRDWFQLSLKEGLTVYRDQEFTSDMRSRAVKRIGDARALRASQFPEDAGPLAHPPRPDNYAEINNFYTSTVYNKGAEIVRMLATLLGADGFRQGLDLYFDRHDGEATTIESWIKTFEDSSGRDLSQFAKWYTQAGTPEVTASGHWDEANHVYTLSLIQTNRPTPGQSQKEPMHIPLKFGLVGPNGQDMMWTKVSGGTVEGDVITLNTLDAKLVFEGVSNKPVLSLLREFSAPVNLVNAQTDNEQLFMAQHDGDPFNRWQASQGMATTMMATAAQGNGKFDSDQVMALAKALGDSLTSETLDNAFKALVMNLPDEGAVRQAIGKNIDPAKVHVARRTLLKEISRSLTEKLSATYDDLNHSGPASQDLQEVQNRALRSQCLSMLVAGQSGEADALATSHYYNANNMSDRMAALWAIVNRWNHDAQVHLTHFRDEFGGDPLIRDKWLTLIALAPDEACLSRVRAIYEDADFPRTNPNRLHALISSFTMGNVAQFTRPDGEGFEFVANIAREVDDVNPYVSAAIMESFGMWRMWETNRACKAKAVLQDLANRQANSGDLRDILTRTLAVQK